MHFYFEKEDFVEVMRIRTTITMLNCLLCMGKVHVFLLSLFWHFVFILFYSCREGDSFDMRKKLPFSVGLLLRLLKKNHRVFVTCTSGFDRSPACVIAYLHWMTDTSLNAAYNFVTGLHSCRPDRCFLMI